MFRFKKVSLMNKEQTASSPLSFPDQQALQDILADSDTGRRAPHDRFSIAVLWIVPLFWSLFQLWIASPLPFILNFGILNDTQTRAIHLAFALFLAFIAFPAFKSSPRHHIPLLTWGAALCGAAAASYLCYAYADLAQRSGAPNVLDLVVAATGLVLLLEATRRSMGIPLTAVALLGLAYVFFGDSPYIPDVIQWKGASFAKTMSHMWLTTEGVFGVALGVSSGFVFLFVLFGSLLNQAGAGNYFLQLAFSAFGHLRGGPAKAAVIASAATGLVSGSSIANVVTTGTFTIPLMRRVGFSSVKAGAIEVSSSVNGVLTPPVMGAVAFLMTEYVGVPYTEVMKTAILPAAISYIALLYIVHLEAVKSGMKGSSTTHWFPFMIRSIFGTAGGIAAAALLFLSASQLVSFLEIGLGRFALVAILVLLFLAYIFSIRLSAQAEDLPMDLETMEHLPPFGQIFKTGLHYLIPVFLLMYLLVIEQYSAALAAFWSSSFMILIILTQKPLKGFFRGTGDFLGSMKESCHDLLEGLVVGARNMIGLAAAMGVAGVIVGTVTLTGIGQVMAEFVEFLSGGNLLAMLAFVALLSIILGMGLPTTANYIVVSSLMAGVVVELGAQNGLVLPLIAVHMFVFYFGIMADVTPPVGLASFAAAAISKGDPVRTGIQAFYYSVRTALLPFLFVFNTDLLLIGVGPIRAVFVFITACIAMLLFSAGTMGWFIVRSKLWESIALILVAFTLFRPGFFLDRLVPPYETLPATQLFELIEQAPDGGSVRVQMRGTKLSGDSFEARYILPLKEKGPRAEERLQKGAGLSLREEEGRLFVDNLAFGGMAEKFGIGFDWEIIGVEIKSARVPKEIFYIPALFVLGLVCLMQFRRQVKETLGVR